MQHRIYPKDARNLYGPRLVRASAHKYFVREPKPRTAEIIFEIPQKHEFSKPGQAIPQPCFFTDKIVLTSLARVFRSDYCGVLFGEYYHRGKIDYFRVGKPTTAKHVLVKTLSARQTPEYLRDVYFRDGGYIEIQSSTQYMDYVVFDSKIIPMVVREYIEDGYDTFDLDSKYKMAYLWLQPQIESLAWSFKLNVKSVRVDMRDLGARRFRFTQRELRLLHDEVDKRKMELKLRTQVQQVTDANKPIACRATTNSVARSKITRRFTGNAMELALRRAFS